MTDGIGEKPPANTGQGMPRWLVMAFATKLVLVILIVAAVVWWAGR